MSPPTRHQGVAYALDEHGQVAEPRTAPKRAPYTCLICQETVSLRRGRVRAAHFAHRPQTVCTATGESIEHAAFKRLLAERLRAHRRFAAHLTCPACRHEQLLSFSLQESDEVREEVPVGTFRADVAVLRAGEPVLIFEVLVSHEVSPEKAGGLNVTWLEVSANAAALLDPARLPKVRARDTNLFRTRPCRSCGTTSNSQAELELERRRQEEARREEERARLAAWKAARDAAPKEPKRSVRVAPPTTSLQDALQAYTLRDQAQRPPTWVTPDTPGYQAYRAPLRVIVGGRALLVHPSLLLDVNLCQDHQGRYAFAQFALRHYDGAGRERYASTEREVSRVLTELLEGAREATPQAQPLLAELRALLLKEA